MRMKTTAQKSAHKRGKGPRQQFHDLGVDQRLLNIAKGRCHKFVVLDCETKDISLTDCMVLGGSIFRIPGGCTY